MRRHIFWYKDWHICNLLSWEAIQFTEGYFREKSSKMHKKKYRSIMTENVPNGAPIELPNSAFESADASEQNAQPQWVYISLIYICMYFLRHTSKKIENSQSQSFTLRALENSDKRLTKTRVRRFPKQFFKGYTLHILAFLQTNHFAWQHPNSSRKSSNSTFFWFLLFLFVTLGSAYINCAEK